MRDAFMALAAGITIAVSAFTLSVGCGEDPVPIYRQPACEPADELLVERALKEGFRKLYERDLSGATQAFDRALSLAPNHPEAMAGKREVRLLKQAAKAPAPR